MRQTLAVLMTVVMAVSVVGAVPIAALASEDGGLNYAVEEDGDQSSPAPGEQLSGSVSVGAAEVEGDVDARSFGHAVAAAETDDERAQIVGERAETVEQRLETLRERLDVLQERRAAGEISQREYRVKTAKLAAELSNVERTANQTTEVAAELPTDVLERNDVDVDRIRTLRENASELRGGEVAEIASGIAGSGAGGAPDDPPGERGPPNASEVGVGVGVNGTDAGNDSANDAASDSAGDAVEGAGADAAEDAETNATNDTGVDAANATDGDGGNTTGVDGTNDGSDAGDEANRSTDAADYLSADDLVQTLVRVDPIVERAHERFGVDAVGRFLTGR